MTSSDYINFDVSREVGGRDAALGGDFIFNLFLFYCDILRKNEVNREDLPKVRRYIT